MFIKRKVMKALTLAALCLPVASFASERIVTIGPGVTEIVYALHQGEQVIATDTSSRIPVSASKLPKVGYYRGLSSEGLLSLKPSRLIGTEDMGPSIVLEQVKKAGVEVTVLPGGYSLESLGQRIEQLSTALGQQDAGNELWASTQKTLEQAKAVSKDKKPLKVIFMMAHTGTAMLAGNDTAANTLIELAGGVNPAKANFTGYKPVSAESLLMMSPDLIIVSSATLHQEGSPAAVLQRMPGLQATPAGRDSRVLTIDGSVIMSGLGPRVGDAALKLATQMYGSDNTTAVAKN
ncbi:heme/hemin ABC transporter substrate-binding protein [Sansalvadorimonas verongulae]|uniref:heme/hemin ABC transporter substrate-binding protein n=1 Tax=Sansalvadorimonas verongulae TaxID=2172824 RepID=UPI0012BBB97D|nr:ABC transporter substrate-binding protein [Sansalvadorimonas verongulae]MTI13622.1 hemin ABC transporter substrate-binding protein [Sansalvadorimonas verongulae]